MNKEILIKKLRLAMPMLIFMIIYLLIFAFLEIFEFPNYHLITCKLDRMIPFCSFFILPYISWFILIPCACVMLLFKNEKEYEKTAVLLMLGMGAFIIISFLFPNCTDIRMPIAENDICSKMVALIYRVDAPKNVFPSIHVYNSLAILPGIYNMRKDFKYKHTYLFIGIASITIIISTVFLKQHSLVDVIGAFVIFVVNLLFVRQYELLEGKGGIYEKKGRIWKFKHFRFGRS